MRELLRTGSSAHCIGDAESLLLLDNLEQVVDAAPDLAALVKRCPALRIVATSRTALRVAGEQEYYRSRCSCCHRRRRTARWTALLAYPSVALFVERARSAKTVCALTPANAVTVAAVCARLDGLPWRSRAGCSASAPPFPRGIAGTPRRPRTRRARVFSARPPRAPADAARHDTRAIRSSTSRNDACSDACPPSWEDASVEDAEAVCAEPGGSCLDQLESLVDKALVQVDGSGRPAPVCSRPSASSHASSSTPPTRPPRSHCATPGGTHRPLRRYATASRAPTRSVRSSEADRRGGGEPPGRARHAPRSRPRR